MEVSQRSANRIPNGYLELDYHSRFSFSSLFSSSFFSSFSSSIIPFLLLLLLPLLLYFPFPLSSIFFFPHPSPSPPYFYSLLLFFPFCSYCENCSIYRIRILFVTGTQGVFSVQCFFKISNSNVQIYLKIKLVILFSKDVSFM